jgi:hypothetical protein
MQERKDVSDKLKRKQAIGGRKNKQQPKAIWQLAAEARSLASEKDWQQLPADLSKHFDEYHYGSDRDQA